MICQKLSELLVNEKRLQTLAEKLLADTRVSGVLIRPHPKNLFLGFDDWLASLNDSRVRRSSGDSSFADLKEIDVVFAGNSSILIEAAIAGRTSGYVPNLDYGSPDLHRFVERGLIYPVNEDLKFDFDQMRRFYRHPEWLSVLRLFADIDADDAAVKTRIKSAIQELYSAGESS